MESIDSYSICSRIELGISKHFIKIAFRNILRYRTQTIISVVSLAVGFTCFVLSLLWIRYELSFDNFYKNAKNKYVVYRENENPRIKYDRKTSIPLAAYLKDKYPEIANAIPLNSYSYTIDSKNRLGEPWTITVNDRDYKAHIVQADSSFLSMFEVKILAGRRDFLHSGSFRMAITPEKSRQLFGNDNPIGKNVVFGRKSYTISAIIEGKNKPSNYPYDMLIPFDNSTIVMLGESIDTDDWRILNSNTIIELFTGVDIKAFEKKLFEHEYVVHYESDIFSTIGKLFIIPLTKIHYSEPEGDNTVSFQYIIAFAVCGLLVVVCSLFNYFISVVSRFRIRQKELALRVIYGASYRSLFSMLSVEFIFMLLIAVGLGCLFTKFVHRPFLNLSLIKVDLSTIYLETLLYSGGIMVVSLIAYWMILLIFKHQSLNLSIRKSNTHHFRSASIVIQLVLSIGIAFCSLIIMKQMYFQHHSGKLGFTYKNRGEIILSRFINGDKIAQKLRQIPEITDVVHTARSSYSLVGSNPPQMVRVTSWDDKPDNMEEIVLKPWYISPEYVNFYEFRLLEGEMLTESDPEEMVLINESAVADFSWLKPVGKQFIDRFSKKIYTVKGVINNTYNFGPTIQVPPSFYSFSQTQYARPNTVIMFKYRKGTWKQVKEKIESLVNEWHFPIQNMEVEYDKYLKSENALIKLLLFISLICILVCVFGFVSLVSLTCEERRKSIAIHKINGATQGNILALFVKEYFWLLLAGAVIAFMAGYYIMRRWLENYKIQTSIPAWIFLTIFFVFVLVVALSVGWRVYKSSNENPAEVLKSE